jgi:hypothetical protein
MKQTAKIVFDLEDENPSGARDSIKSILNQKVAEILDKNKPDVAQSIGNSGAEEVTEGINELDLKDSAVIRAFLKQRPLKGQNLISTNKKKGDFDQGTFRIDVKNGDEGIVSWYADDDGELKIALADVGWMVKATPITVLVQQEILSVARRQIGYKASGVDKDLNRYMTKFQKD